jgi:spermidine/putrescine-binding protein
MASPFPHYFIGNGKSLINYNYFVINKNTKNYNLANDFLAYLISEEGQNAYLDAYPYYLPAMVKLEEKRLEKKVNTNFNIVLKDFMDKEFIFSSFNKGLKFMYDKEITNILDDEANATNSFERLKNILLCKYNKMVKFEKLSVVCK